MAVGSFSVYMVVYSSAEQNNIEKKKLIDKWKAKLLLRLIRKETITTQWLLMGMTDSAAKLSFMGVTMLHCINLKMNKSSNTGEELILSISLTQWEHIMQLWRGDSGIM